MGWITSLFVRKVVRQVDERLDHAALLRSVGIDLEETVDPKQMVAADDYYGLLERIAESDPRAGDLPLRTGASMRLDEYGAMGLAWKSAPHLRASWKRAVRYARVLTSVATYQTEDGSDQVHLIHHRVGERRRGLLMSNEATIASLYAISQQVSSAPIRLLEVRFEHAPLVAPQIYEAHFGCPVRFRADHDALHVPKADADRPNRLADQGISRFFEVHLEQEVAALEENVGLDRRVRCQISEALSDGVPTISHVAARLGMGARTLQRRLSEDGHSFQSLVDEARRRLAQRLLRETDYALADVAFLTGFSEQSAFTRAFKRWEGQTPRSFRLATQTARNGH